MNWLIPSVPETHQQPARQNMFDATEDELSIASEMTPPRSKKVVARENEAVLELLRKRISPCVIYHKLAKEGYFKNSKGVVMSMQVMAPTFVRLRKKHGIPMYETKAKFVKRSLYYGIHVDDIRAYMGSDSAGFSSHLRYGPGKRVSDMRSQYMRNGKMDLKTALKEVIEPGLIKLPDHLNTVEAEAMLLAIGMQETKFELSNCVNSDRMGFFRVSTRDIIKLITIDWTSKLLLDIANGANKFINELVLEDAHFCALCARLMLSITGESLPNLNSDPSESWNLYLKTWKPDNPKRETWDAYWMHALYCVRNNSMKNEHVDNKKDIAKTW